MLAKDIAAGLDGNWNTVSDSNLYLHSTRRIRVIVEEYQPNYVGVFIPENEDYIASDKDFVNEFQKSIGSEICPAQEMQLIEAMTQDLSNWAKNFDKNDQTIVNFLQKLIDNHNEDKRK